MKKTFFIILLIMVFLILASCSGRADAVSENSFFPAQEPFTNEIMLSDVWKEDEIPSLGSDNWPEANHGADILITVKNNMIVTMDNEYEYISEYEIKTDQGRIIGIDGGEWGGQVKFAPNFGLGYTVIEENCRGFYSTDNRLFVLTGLGHMAVDEGNVYELTFHDGKWSAEKTLDLQSSPQAYLLVEETLYLITNKALFVIENGEIVKQIAGDDNWASLSPNSIVVANSTLYMGTNGGMFAVDLSTHTIERYVLNNSLHN